MSETNDAKIEEEVDKASVKLKFVSGSVSSCNLCDKTFFDKNELDGHIRKRHTKWKLGWPALPFKCDLCGAEYVGESELKDYIEEHHRSCPKPPVEDRDGEHKEEIGKTAADEENTRFS